MKNSFYLYLILAFLYSPQIFAGENLSLMQAITSALENNYGIRIVQQQEQIASINNHWGTAGRFPNINLAGGTNNRFIHNENSTPAYREATHSHNLYAGINMQWTLFHGFAVQINKHKLEQLETLSKGHTSLMIENTIEEVILSYYQVLLENEKLKVLDTVLLLVKDRYHYMQERKKLGSAVSYDVLQAQNDYLEEKSNRLIQQLKVNNAYRNLAKTMGLKETEHWEINEQYTIKEHIFSLESLQQQMISDNTALRNQYINQTILAQETQLRKAERYPDLQLGSGLQGTQAINKLVEKSHRGATSFDYYVNLSLSYKLFTGGQRKRAIEIAKINEEIAQLSIDEILIDLNNKLVELVDYYHISHDLLTIATERQKAAELNLNISQDKLANGTINSFNFRDILHLYLSASIHRLEAMFSVIQKETEILRMTGAIVNHHLP